MFLIQLVLGGLLLIINIIIHAVVLDRLLLLVESIGPKVYRIFYRLWKVPMLVIAVTGTMAAHILEIWLWALLYFSIDALPSFESALYFSTSTFTTVGFGDIVLSSDWRLISSFQSAIGFLLFGWSTAFIFEIMTKLYKQEEIKKTD
jgi:hypothetical protein